MDLRTSATGSDLSPGSIVYLLVEVQGGGHIHEIGSRARVLSTDGDAVMLEVGDGSTVSCAAAYVELGAARRSRSTVARPRLGFGTV